VVRVKLLPAIQGTRDYQVTVTPQATAEFQGGTFEIGVGPNGGMGKDLWLLRRLEVSGRVVDSGGLPFDDVIVQPGVASLASTSPEPVAEMVKLSSGTTHADGRFTVRVDVGTYDFGLQPLPATLMPRRWIDRKEVLSDFDLGTLLLPPGVQVRARVVDADGIPLKGATISVYTLPCPSGQSESCQSPPRLMAEGVSGELGTAFLILPTATAPLAGVW
jgi:hypothetical protein